MVSVQDIAEREAKEAGERLERASTKEHAASLESALPSLAKSIRAGTVTVNDIDSFLNKFPNIQTEIKGYLLSKKGYLLFQQGKQEDGLRNYDVSLATKETPSTWALKGTALLQMGRIDKALQAFQEAFDLRDDFGPQKQEYLKDLFSTWGTTMFFLGLDAVLAQDSRELENRVKEFLAIEDKARNEGLAGIPGGVVFREPAIEELSVSSDYSDRNLIIETQETPELRDALEELALTIKLLSIKDPFEGFRALSREISKYWPEGLSAVDAIREQRDREWNT